MTRATLSASIAAEQRRILGKSKRKCHAPSVGTPFGTVRTGVGCIITIPLRTENPLNNRKHWFRVSQRAKKEKERVAGYMLEARPLPALPVAVRLTRFGPGTRKMDSDGLAASFKHVRDSIAAAYGIDDADKRITFLPCEQDRAKEYAVRIEIVHDRADKIIAGLSDAGSGTPAREGNL